MKIYYANTGSLPVTITIKHRVTFDASVLRTEETLVVQPKTGKFLEVHAPKGTIPVIRQLGPTDVVITYMDEDREYEH